MKISFINDEFSEDIDECIDFCSAFNIEYIELRKISGNNIANISSQEIINIKNKLSKHNIHVSCIASPFLKWKQNEASSEFGFKKLNDDNHYLTKLQNFAEILDAPNIRIFSYLKDTNFNINSFSKYLLYLDKQMEISNKKLLLENEPVCNISTISALYNIFLRNNFQHIEPLIDLGNAFSVHENINNTELNTLIEKCNYYHIKDYSKRRNNFITLGEGDIKFKQILRHKMAKENIFLSLETHTKKTLDVQNSLLMLRTFIDD